MLTTTRCPTFIAVLLVGWLPSSHAADNPNAASTNQGVDVTLHADRMECHPGESVELQGVIANIAKSDLKLPGVDFARQYAFVRLHIAKPDGEEFLFDPYADNPLRSSLTAISAKSFVTNFATGTKQTLFEKAMRLTDGLTRWTSHEHSKGPMSLRAIGEYRIWFDYLVPAVSGMLQEAWTGSAKSNTLVLTVIEFKPHEQSAKPTTEQLEAIAKLQHGAPTAIDMRDSLQHAMMRVENEALARHLVDLCLRDAPRATDFIAMIANRSCNPDPEEGINAPLQLGIDGPYLKTAAMAALDAFDNPGSDPNHLRVFRSGSAYGINIAIAYLRFHREDTTSRDHLIKLAKLSAPLPLPPQMKVGPLKPAENHAQSKPLSSAIAWQILLELDVLRSGMPVGDAIEILGQPSRRSDKSLTWYIDTPRHVNPGLAATIDRGKVVSFRRYSG